MRLTQIDLLGAIERVAAGGVSGALIRFVRADLQQFDLGALRGPRAVRRCLRLLCPAEALGCRHAQSGTSAASKERAIPLARFGRREGRRPPGDSPRIGVVVLVRHAVPGPFAYLQRRYGIPRPVKLAAVRSRAGVGECSEDLHVPARLARDELPGPIAPLPDSIAGVSQAMYLAPQRT
jgi:hypothetical protein